ncbi:response regulator [Mesorhizobium sp. M3A.F.Ca.ET.080.04.2.1]|nr:response regulator [Mesorhizobium sp. M3A.F.Ca.ET.080.04.2.1]PBB85444.1 histidine kinase [Mesorhizobium sp. WSM3876]RWB71829.1 MAG: response regulator [Mesorhizobium sp.]TGS61995.1 response regulator [Mesorhizobium sp. M3A.F.Ca.ET.201.01.1.1]TGT56944.1 response regulator [Mesorhizobium sp. M00.F.Ca.ET.170.01.1.1]
MRWQALPLLGGFVIVAAIVGGRAILAETQIADRVASRRSIETQQLLAGLLSLTQDAETGQRGYLLTGEKTYLQPYQHAVEALPGQLARIDQMLPASSEAAQQVAGIKEALARKQSELAETIRLYDAGNMSKALEIVRGGSGKLDMEQIQANIDAIRRIDGANLQARALRMEQVEDWLRAGSFAALAAILLLGLYTIRESGRRFRAVVIAQDALSAKNAALENEIHTRERAESQLRQVQKMEAVGQLTGGIAHDFNNMLAVITSAMNLAQRKLARGEHDVETFVEAAADAAARAANLTARLLAFSRQQPLAPQLVDANRLVTGMSDLLRRTLGQSIEIETVLAGGLWKAHADPSQVENAILNLAVNARDAIGEKGKLTIETANCHLDEAYAAGHPEVKAGQYVMIAVTDTGTGMSPDVMARAFEPFFTTKPVNHGTGLGLSQVFGFVKQSGGHVKIYSEPGEGTTIKIYLPRFAGPEEAAPFARLGGKAEPAATETVLLVEDDARVRSATSAALLELGYTVIEAGSGEEALGKLGENPAIALMLTDIVMPAMNGRQLAEEAKGRAPSLKIVFMTGFTRNAVVHNGVLDHDVNFIAKPFTLEQLSAKLRDALAKP